MAFSGFLRQSTAVDILIGPFLDDTDGKTAETGLTLDVELSKNGQALANKNDATAPVHDGAGNVDGYYNCEFNTTDTNTVGQLTVVAHASGALPVRLDFQVIEEAIYDELFKSAATLGTKIDTIAADVVNIDGFDMWNETIARVALVDTATNVTNQVNITPGAANSVWGVTTRTLSNQAAFITAIWHKLLSGITTASTIGKLIKDYLDAAVTSRAPASEYDTEMARITADVATEAKQDVIAADVVNINGDAMRGTDGANTIVPDAAGTAAGLHSTTDGKVDALNDLSAQNVRDAMKLAPSGNSPAAGSIDKHLDDAVEDTNELQTDDIPGKLTALESHGDGVWVTAIGFSTHAAADIWSVGTRTLTSFGSLIADIWHRLLTGITTAGSIGKLLKDNVNATIGSRSSHSAADVKTAVEAAGSSLDFIKNVIEGDAEVDINTTPYQLVIKVKGTDTELIRKDLKDIVGADLTTIATVVGRQSEPS